MKLQIALVAFIAAFVPQIVAQGTARIDPRILARLRAALAPRTPSKPSQPVIRDYYPTNDQNRLLLARQKLQTQEERKQKEIQMYRELRSMSTDQLKRFFGTLNPDQLKHVLARLRYLRATHGQKLKQPQQTGSGSTGGQNTVLSGANRVRPSKDANTASSPSSSLSARARGLVAALRRIQALRRRRPSRTRTNPFMAYHSYQSKAKKAIAAGCTRPMSMENPMETFMMFSAGGCAVNGAVCYMSGQSCVDVGMSIMCCPPGYSSGTISLFNQMQQMQKMMAAFQ